MAFVRDNILITYFDVDLRSICFVFFGVASA